jgi:hypothetical protein
MKRSEVGLILVGLVTLGIGLAVPSCTDEQLRQADRTVKDVNDATRKVKQLAESPEGAALIPPAVRSILELLGFGGAAAFGIWQKIRASKILEKKQGVDVTLKAVVDAIDQAELKAADPIKAKIKQTMRDREIFTTANAIVDEHRSRLTNG